MPHNRYSPDLHQFIIQPHDLPKRPCLITSSFSSLPDKMKFQHLEFPEWPGILRIYGQIRSSLNHSSFLRCPVILRFISKPLLCITFIQGVHKSSHPAVFSRTFIVSAHFQCQKAFKGRKFSPSDFF